MQKLEDKIDSIADRINNIDITLGKQSVILEEHIRRTNLLEEKLAPIEKHVYMVNGALKVIGFLAICLGIIEGVLKLIGR